MNTHPRRTGRRRTRAAVGAALTAALAVGTPVLAGTAAHAAGAGPAGAPVTESRLTDPSAAEIGASLNTSFVTHDGAHLRLDGQTFRFNGTNAYWLALDENVPPGTVDYPTFFRIRDAIDTAQDLGATVIRSHMLVSTGNAKSLLPSKEAGYNEDAWSTIDYAIAYAGSKGIRLVLPLTDNWAYYHGGLRDFARTYGLCEDSSADCPQFYSDPRIIADFQDYVRTALNHVNPYTGLALKDDPTVMAWELGNELEGMTPSWIDTISSQLKDEAPRQLVAAGRRFDIDPDTLAASKVDVVDVHYYPPTVAKVTADAKTITDAGKAYIAGEYDSNAAATVLPSLTADANVTGMLSWSLFPHDDTSGFVQHDDGFQIHYPADDATMRANVAAQQDYARSLGTAVAPTITRAPLVTSVTSDYGLHRLAWRGATGATGYLVQREDGTSWTTLTTDPVGDAPWLDTATQGAATYRVVPVAADGTHGPASDPVTVGAGEQLTVDAVGSLTPLATHTGLAVHPLGEDAVVVPTSTDGGSATWSAPGLRSVTLSVAADAPPALTLEAATADGTWTTLDAHAATAGDGRWTVTADAPAGADRLRVTWPAGVAATETGLTRVALRATPDEAVLADPLDDLSLTSAHTSTVGIDSGNATLFGGDTGRATRTSAGAGSAEWSVSSSDAPQGLTGFDATAYYWPDQAAEPLTFAVSDDGATWRDVTPAVTTTPGAVGGSWTKDAYSVRGLSGVRHVRVTWPDGSTPEWAQQLGDLRLLASAADGVAAPAAVTTTAPADAATDVRGVPALTWKATARAAVYRVTLSRHADLRDPVASTETSATTFTPAIALDEAARYYWQVTAVNGAGTSSSKVASFRTATRPTTPTTADDFESYATGADVAAAYVRNTGGGAITPTLTPSGAGTGHGNALRLTYDLGSPGYAGVTRTFGTAQDWWGYDGLSLWLDRSKVGAGQSLSVQIVANGAYYEATLPGTGPAAAGVVTVPFDAFVPPSWASGEGPLDLTSVTQLSFYLGGSGTGVLDVDDVRAVRTTQATGTAGSAVLALALPPVTRAGDRVDVLVQVLGLRGTATGTVTVRDEDGVPMGTATLAKGRATVKVTAPPTPGTVRLALDYAGDPTYAPAHGSAWLYVLKGARR
ncbi:hypothetical protein GCM10025864_18040 [Luteimicrobium album]|uniref:mannan endo-1,4-beta-mannosidase n=1 Tax=Luteimicrobium album TaxID=1054550 RepID=A0ABQ6I2M7_9MICO|nr:Ig-like domain repeat protein [Luteimicrobium album]GMA24045.1 hypothetical protein GCM10025864_18040 [Luteimicrobium album]